MVLRAEPVPEPYTYTDRTHHRRVHRESVEAPEATVVPPEVHPSRSWEVVAGVQVVPPEELSVAVGEELKV